MDDTTDNNPNETSCVPAKRKSDEMLLTSSEKQDIIDPKSCLETVFGHRKPTPPSPSSSVRSSTSQVFNPITNSKSSKTELLIKLESTFEIVKNFDRIPKRGTTSRSPKVTYKPEVDREKHDQAQLPGWSCAECRMYYQDLESQMDERELARLQNKCLKHQSQVDLNSTPEGFCDARTPSTPDLYAKGYIRVRPSTLRVLNTVENSKSCKTDLHEKLESTFDAIKDIDRIPNRGTSPTFNYKPEVVRRKHERAQLPGWDCAECRMYYQDLESQMDERELARMKNKCSKHKSKFQVDLNSTPEGFWDTRAPSTPDLYAKGYIRVARAAFTPVLPRRSESDSNESGSMQNRNVKIILIQRLRDSRIPKPRPHQVKPLY